MGTGEAPAAGAWPAPCGRAGMVLPGRAPLRRRARLKRQPAGLAFAPGSQTTRLKTSP